MQQRFLSIIIPTYNSASFIGQAIEACLAQDYPKDKIEIIVVDDASTDGTKGVVAKYPVKYIYQKKGGPAVARNRGYESAKGEVIFFTDSDCVVHKDWVSTLVKHYNKNDLGAVTGSYAVGDSQYLLDKFVHYEIEYRHSMMPKYVNSFGTYNVLIKRSVFKELKGFDPSYTSASGEDNDLSYRIINAGYKIYFEKNALVGHCNVLRFFKYILVQFRHSYWRMKLYKKYTPMILKDKYGYWKDFTEVFLVISLILSLFIDFQYKPLALGLLLGSLFTIQLPLAVKISLEQKDFRYVIFSFITFIRAFVRVLGGIFGIISFWIAKR